MTARAYPARQVAKPRVTARERLLEQVDRGDWSNHLRAMAKTRRLLALTLREYGACMCALNDLKFAAAMHAAGVPPEMAQRVGEFARSAVLASSGRRKGRK